MADKAVDVSSFLVTAPNGAVMQIMRIAEKVFIFPFALITGPTPAISDEEFEKFSKNFRQSVSRNMRTMVLPDSMSHAAIANPTLFGLPIVVDDTLSDNEVRLVGDKFVINVWTYATLNSGVMDQEFMNQACKLMMKRENERLRPSRVIW